MRNSLHPKNFICVAIGLFLSLCWTTNIQAEGTAFLAFEQTSCDNVTSGGQIRATEITGCLPGFNPGPIVNVTHASGGSGALEYLWMQSTNPIGSTDLGWMIIPTATGADYDPDFISRSTAYRRCARRAGCSSWEIESNIVIIYVEDCNTCDNVTNPGLIGPNQAFCGDEFDPSEIENLSSATGGSGAVEYQWYRSTVNVPFVLPSPHWNPISGATARSYNPGLTNVTTYFVRGARRENCDAFRGSNIVVVEINPEPSLTVDSQTNVNCHGGADGSINISVSGGTPPYDIQWDNGVGSVEDPSGLTAGSYTVTIRDAKLCNATATVTIDEPTLLELTIVSSSNGVCQGASDGSIEVSASGGTAPYTFAWNHDATADSGTVSGLGAGTYTVTITDNNDCEVSETITIESYDLPDVNAGPNRQMCAGSGITIDATISGTAPLTILWTTTGGNLSNANTEDPGFNMMAAGVYTLTVTVTDGNGCVDTDQMDVSVVPNPTADAGTDLNKCASDGPLSLNGSASGGTAPYTFAWTASAGTLSNAGIANPTYQMMMPGTYTLTMTVTDGNGCTDVDQLTVTVNDEPTVDAGGDLTKCASDAVQLDATVSGGTSPYAYQWSASGGSFSNANIEDPTYQMMMPGTYTLTLTVTDANGCTDQDQLVVEVAEDVTVDLSKTDVICNGASDGTATANVSGGSGNLTYAWSQAGQSGATATGLDAGQICVTVTDQFGCSDSDCITIDEPTQLNLTLTKTDIECNGENNGTATASVSGGTPGYTYSWSNGGSGTSQNGLGTGQICVTASDANGCTVSDCVIINEASDIQLSLSNTDITCNGDNNGTATANASGGTGTLTYAWTVAGSGSSVTGLSAGQVCVTVTDENDCSKSDCVMINEPSAINLSLSTTDIDCNGDGDGTATATASGGTGTLDYSWSVPGSGNTSNLTGLDGGQVCVTVTDDNGCQESACETINEPSALSLTLNKTDIDCNGDDNGTATASASGGTPGYTYAWSNGGSGATQNGLGMGQICVTATDANGCTISDCVSINEASDIQLSLSKTDITCNGDNDGTATATASGGTGGLTYSWSVAGTGSSVSGLGAGQVCVTVTDGNGCSKMDCVTINEPPAISLNLSVTDIDCNGDGDGTAAASASGGTGTLSYSWSIPGTGNTSNLTGLDGGQVCVTVTDENGCQASECETINEPTALSLVLSKTDIDCNGDDTGTATATVSGGTPGYTYAWSNGGSGSSQSGLGMGQICVTVMDANGCTISDCVNIDEASDLGLVLSGTDITCNGDNDGTASATVSGGTPGYTYAWSNGASTSSVSGLPGGEICLTVTDANGCDIRDCITITEPAPLVLVLDKEDIDCNGDNNGSASATVSGGTPGYTYAWSNGSGNSTVNGLSAGQICLTVTDANGCAISDCVNINEPSPLILEFQTVDIECNGDNDGVVAVIASGGTPGYTYAWNNGSTSSTIDGLGSGQYCVTVTDSNGCTISDCVTINEPSGMTCNAQVTSPYDCLDISSQGATDGSASVTVTGGTPGYTYSWSHGPNSADVGNLGSGTYTVVVTDDNGCQCTASVTLEEPARLGDFVFEDLDVDGVQDPGEPGIEGVKVIVTGTKEDGTPYMDMTFTNPDGSYDFDNLPPGTYKITFETPTDYIGTIPNAGTDESKDSDADPSMGGMTNTVTLGPGDNNPDLDAGYVLKGSIGDYVWEDLDSDGVQDPNEPGVEDINVMLMGTDFLGNSVMLSTMTDSNGFYLFDDLLPGSYKVVFKLPGGATFTNNDQGGDDTTDSDANPGDGTTPFYDLGSGEDYRDFDAGIISKISIGDYVWHDEDMDGIQDADEMGINGVMVKLIQAGPDGVYCTADDVLIDTETTATNNGNKGFYQFDNVCSGEYVIVFMSNSFPHGFNLTEGNQGSDDAVDSDADQNTGKTDPIVVTPNTGDIDDIDAGLFEFCDNVTDGGIIGGNEEGCGPNFDPATITNLALPSGGTGPLEYLWLKSLVGTPFSPDSPYWMEIAGADGASYDPGPIMYTTYYIRCARRAGCDDYIGESNVVVKVVGLCDADCTDNVFNGGLINNVEVNCGPFDPEEMGSSSLPSGGNGTVEYSWMYTTDNPLMGAVTWITIPNSNAPTYDPGSINETRYYKRSSRTLGCNLYANSNLIVKEVKSFPAAVVVSAPTELCLGQTYTFEAQDAGTNAFYTWYFGSGADPNIGSGRMVAVDYSTLGQRTVTLQVDVRGCSSYTDFDIDVVDDPNNCPNLNIQIVNAAARATTDRQVALEWTVISGLEKLEFFIQRSADGLSYETITSMQGDLIPLEREIFSTMDAHPYVGKSYYKIMAKSPWGYEVYSNILEVDMVGQVELDRVIASPNPVMEDITTIILAEPLFSDGELAVYSTDGKPVRRIAVSQKQRRVVVDLTNLPAGVYYVKIHADRAPKSVTKLIKITD